MVVGSTRLLSSRSSPDYKMGSWLPVVEDGKVVWPEVGGSIGGL